MVTTLTNTLPLTDRLGRVHHSLRISVTDRCNIRCFYCMPNENVRFRPRHEILSFEEITRFVRIVSQMGLRRLRLTGGEPLVRADLPQLVEQLATIGEVEDLALTTNGILLAEQAAALRRAGLRRLNVSLDTLSEDTFLKISRRPGLDRVLAGIAAAQEAGFESIRLNAIAIRSLTEVEIVPLAGFARDRGLELRFIEYMPLDADGHWQAADVLDGEAIRRLLEAEFGLLHPVPPPHPSQPATDFEYADGGGRIGLINPVSQPFCGTAIDCGSLPRDRSAIVCSPPASGTPASCSATAGATTKLPTSSATAYGPKRQATASAATSLSGLSGRCTRSAVSSVRAAAATYNRGI